MPFCWDSNFPSVRGEVWLRWAPNLTLIFLWFNGPPPSPEGPSRVIHDQRPAPTPFCSAQNPGCCVFFAQRRLQVLQETCVACPDDGHSNNLLHVLAIRLPRHCILAQCATGGHPNSPTNSGPLLAIRPRRLTWAIVFSLASWLQAYPSSC